MYIYIVWKKSISGWSKELIKAYKDNAAAQEYIQSFSSCSQYYLEIEKIKIY